MKINKFIQIFLILAALLLLLNLLPKGLLSRLFPSDTIAKVRQYPQQLSIKSGNYTSPSITCSADGKIVYLVVETIPYIKVYRSNEYGTPGSWHLVVE